MFAFNVFFGACRKTIPFLAAILAQAFEDWLVTMMSAGVDQHGIAIFAHLPFAITALHL
jgi:hypothetical protein